MAAVAGEHEPGAPLSDPARLRALAESGLTASADPEMEYFAQRVRTLLDVPVALVGLVQADRQVFPGMVGMPDPWATRRRLPLSHSFCQHVVSGAAALVVPDARRHALVRDNLAIPDFGWVAYAGMPLTDGDGRVLGALSAVDVVPRQWTVAELDALGALAQACSTAVRLRLADFLTERERARRDELERLLRAALERTQLLLTASQALTDAANPADIRRRVADLVSVHLAPSYVGLAVSRDRGHLERIPDPGLPPGVERLLDCDLDAPLATAKAARERRLVSYSDRDAFDAEFPEPTRRLYRDLGLHAVICAPLIDAEAVSGVLVLGWDRPRVVDPEERAVITAIADDTARALQRVDLLQHRITVAHELQAAMLTDLPHVEGVEMAARYLPADARERVGGDWYDAVPVPFPTDPSGRVLAVTVGDVIGHTTHAATIMGQVRSMLRQAAWEHPGGPPSRVLSSLENACEGLGVDAAGTAVLAQLHPTRDGTGRWSMDWTNAGHPPPIVLLPDATTVVLDDHDMLFGYPRLLPRRRRDHHVLLEPGAVLLLYTDGLVERRDSDIDEGIAALRALLAGLRDRSVKEIVDTAVATLGGDVPDDDVVAMAVRISDG